MSTTQPFRPLLPYAPGTDTPYASAAEVARAATNHARFVAQARRAAYHSPRHTPTGAREVCIDEDDLVIEGPVAGGSIEFWWECLGPDGAWRREIGLVTLDYIASAAARAAAEAAALAADADRQARFQRTALEQRLRVEQEERRELARLYATYRGVPLPPPEHPMTDQRASRRQTASALPREKSISKGGKSISTAPLGAPRPWQARS